MDEDSEIIILLERHEFECDPSIEHEIVVEEVRIKEKTRVKEKKQKKKEKEERRIRKRSTYDDSEPSTSKVAEIVDYAQKPKKNHRRVICVSCNERIMPGMSALPENSLYCSVNCIKNMVEQCKQCVKENEKINFLDEQGTLIQLPDYQTVYLPILEDFLLKKPSFKPFVDFAKLLPKEPISKTYDAELLAKKEDTIRANVRKTILDQLMMRSKKNKVGISRKATQEFAEQVEMELFKVHKSAKHPKYKEWCSDFFHQLADDQNMFFKSVVTNVHSAKKLITMKKEEMVIALEPIETLPQKLPPKPKPRPQPPPVSQHKVNALDSILGDETSDTTDKHNTHEFDSRCKICVDKVRLKQTQIELMMKDREELLEDRRRRKELGKRFLTNRVEPSNSSSDKWKAESRSDVVSDKSYSPGRNYSPPPSYRYSPRRRVSPKRSRISPARSFTPPPGVSPDNFGVKKVSPVRNKSFRAPVPEFGPDDNNKMSLEELKRNFRDVYNNQYYKTPGLLDAPVNVAPVKTPEVFNRFREKPGVHNIQRSDTYPTCRSPPISLSPQHHARRPHPEAFFNINTNGFPPERPVPTISVWVTKSPIVWAGKIDGDGITLSGTLKAIANPMSLDLKDKIPDLITVKARVRTEPMWNFVNDIKNTRKYQLLLYLVIPNEDDHDSYEKTYNELKDSKRYAVLDLPKVVGAKETYMFRVEPNDGLPDVFESIEGPGLPEVGSETGRLCVLIIKYADIALNQNSPAQSQVISQTLTANKPNNMKEILMFIENAPDAKTLVKGVQEYLHTHKVSPNEKQVIQNVCTAKIEKQKRQSVSVGIPPVLPESQNQKPHSPTPKSTPQNNESEQQENDKIVIEEEDKKEDVTENDFDDKMEIVESEDEVPEKIENKPVDSPYEAGEIRDSPMEIDAVQNVINNNNSDSFILPPPPPPPSFTPLDIPGPRFNGPKVEHSLSDMNMQTNGPFGTPNINDFYRPPHARTSERPFRPSHMSDTDLHHPMHRSHFRPPHVNDVELRRPMFRPPMNSPHLRPHHMDLEFHRPMLRPMNGIRPSIRHMNGHPYDDSPRPLMDTPVPLIRRFPGPGPDDSWRTPPAPQPHPRMNNPHHPRQPNRGRGGKKDKRHYGFFS